MDLLGVAMDASLTTPLQCMPVGIAAIIGSMIQKRKKIMSKIFVIMKSVGEYSDRDVFVLSYTTDETEAQRIVTKNVEADQLQKAIENTKSKIRAEYFPIWNSENPYPNKEGLDRPIFDQSQARDKTYVVAHTQRKRDFEAMEEAYNSEVFVPYLLKRNAELERYVDQHFDPNKLLPVQWTDTQFWYEEVEKAE
jgi:hypothetical protein